MYAVFESGGKQHRVQPGDIIRIEKLESDVGGSLKFDRVLLVAKPGEGDSKLWLGKPLLSGASVDAEVVGQGRGDKTIIVKMKRRKQYRRTQGHRQFLTEILITGVDNGAGEKQALDAAAKKERTDKWFTLLRPVGSAFQPKIVGSRQRIAESRGFKTGDDAKPETPKKEASAKAPAKKSKAKSGGAKKKATKKSSKK
jgi:large subunit ribosomal protein L21